MTSARCFFWMPLLCKVPWAPCNGTTSTPPNFAIAHYNSTLQWHPAMVPRPLLQSWSQPPLQWHPAMAPRPLPQSWPSPSPPSTIAHCNGLQWHPAMAPPKMVAPCPPTIAHPTAHSSGPTMAPYDGTQQWHHVHCTLQWHPGATSNPPKWFVALPPIGSKNPYSYHYLGN